MAVVKEVALPGSASGTSSSRRRATGRRRAPPVGRPRARAVRTRGPRHVARPPSPRSGGRPHARGALGVSQVAKELAELEQDVEGLAVDRLPLAGGSPFAGRTIGDTGARTRTGVSIVAVLRDGSALPPPARRPSSGQGTSSSSSGRRGDRGARGPAPLGPSGARLAVPDRARRRRPVARGPLEDRGVRVLADPLYLSRGSRSGRAGSCPGHRGRVHRGGGGDRSDPAVVHPRARVLGPGARGRPAIEPVHGRHRSARELRPGVRGRGAARGSSPPCSSGDAYISSSGVIARTLDDLGWMGNRETLVLDWSWRTS